MTQNNEHPLHQQPFDPEHPYPLTPTKPANEKNK